MPRAAYRFSHDFQAAIFRALGLEGRRIRRLILTLEVDRPVTMQIDEFATFDTGEPYLVANLLELASFEPPAVDSPDAQIDSADTSI